MRGAWPYLVVTVGGGFAAARMVLRRDAATRRWHALLLRLPWLGPLILSVNTSRFASTLAILLPVIEINQLVR